MLNSRHSCNFRFFYSPSKLFQYLRHRLIRIPDKANKLRGSPGVRTNESLLYISLLLKRKMSKQGRIICRFSL